MMRDFRNPIPATWDEMPRQTRRQRFLVGRGEVTQKFRVPQNPLAAEATSDKITPTSEKKEELIQEYFADKIATTTGVERDAWIKARQQRELDSMDGAIDESFASGFQGFLTGHMKRDIRTPIWGERNLNLMDFEGVREYIDPLASERAQFENDLLKMHEFGPGALGQINLNSLYLYYKYILDGASLTESNFLKDYKRWKSTSRTMPMIKRPRSERDRIASRHNEENNQELYQRRSTHKQPVEDGHFGTTRSNIAEFRNAAERMASLPDGSDVQAGLFRSTREDMGGRMPHAQPEDAPEIIEEDDADQLEEQEAQRAEEEAARKRQQDAERRKHQAEIRALQQQMAEQQRRSDQRTEKMLKQLQQQQALQQQMLQQQLAEREQQAAAALAQREAASAAEVQQRHAQLSQYEQQLAAAEQQIAAAAAASAQSSGGGNGGSGAPPPPPPPSSGAAAAAVPVEQPVEAPPAPASAPAETPPETEPVPSVRGKRRGSMNRPEEGETFNKQQRTLDNEDEEMAQMVADMDELHRYQQQLRDASSKAERRRLKRQIDAAQRRIDRREHLGGVIRQGVSQVAAEAREESTAKQADRAQSQQHGAIQAQMQQAYEADIERQQDAQDAAMLQQMEERHQDLGENPEQQAQFRKQMELAQRSWEAEAQARRQETEELVAADTETTNPENRAALLAEMDRKAQQEHDKEMAEMDQARELAAKNRVSRREGQWTDALESARNDHLTFMKRHGMEASLSRKAEHALKQQFGPTIKAPIQTNEHPMGFEQTEVAKAQVKHFVDAGAVDPSNILPPGMKRARVKPMRLTTGMGPGLQWTEATLTAIQEQNDAAFAEMGKMWRHHKVEWTPAQQEKIAKIMADQSVKVLDEVVKTTWANEGISRLPQRVPDDATEPAPNRKGVSPKIKLQLNLTGEDQSSRSVMDKVFQDPRAKQGRVSQLIQNVWADMMKDPELYALAKQRGMVAA